MMYWRTCSSGVRMSQRLRMGSKTRVLGPSVFSWSFMVEMSKLITSVCLNRDCPDFGIAGAKVGEKFCCY